jgi:hypothetical protein
MVIVGAEMVKLSLVLVQETSVVLDTVIWYSLPYPSVFGMVQWYEPVPFDPAAVLAVIVENLEPLRKRSILTGPGLPV